MLMYFYITNYIKYYYLYNIILFHKIALKRGKQRVSEWDKELVEVKLTHLLFLTFSKNTNVI